MAEKIWFITGASRGFGHIWTEAAAWCMDRLMVLESPLA